MAYKLLTQKFKYKIEMTYLDIAKKRNVEIRTERIKDIVIDYNYDNNCMPVVYASLSLDRKMVDNMILNCNTNLISLAVYKFDDNSTTELDVECFRKKFIYFLHDSVNANDPIDYNEATNAEHLENTFKSVTLGLLCLDHVNNNKVSRELMIKNATIYDCVKYCTSHMDNIIMEPFYYNEKFNQIIMPPKDSINKALQFLNNFRVFYPTPYRFFQEFDYTYIISSSGKATKKSTERYDSIIVIMRDIDEIDANEEGLVINKTTGNYEVIVNYADSTVFDNKITNKSQTILKGISTSGSDRRTLNSQADYNKQKISNIRLNNDNTNMISNLEAKANSANTLISIVKNDLDTGLFTINKRITVRNIERYQDLNGEYLLFRKREIFIRESDTFVLATSINLRKI